MVSILSRLVAALGRFVGWPQRRGRWVAGSAADARGRLAIAPFVAPRRQFLLYVPRGYTRWRRNALIVLCHGCQQTPEDFATGTPGKVSEFDIITPYEHFVRQTVKVGRQVMKIVIDAGNGTGGAVAVPLFKAMGFEVVPLFCEMDARFPNHHPDPTVVENLEDLIAAVKKEKAEVGIAYDGDSDRIGVIDEKGNILWGDQLMILFSRYVLKEAPGAAIVGEVKCSYTLYDDIAKHGGKPVMWKAGHSLIKAKMKEEHAELAGEMSGHIFFKHRYFGFDDAVYSSARLLEILTHEPKTLSELMSDVPKTFASPELRADVPEEKKFEVVKRATEHLRAQGYKIVDVDGVRVTFPDGWGLIRASNTQPILVLRYEAATEARLGEIRKLIESTVETIKAQVGA